MLLTYTLSLSDIKAALRLHAKQDIRRRIRFLIIYEILPVLAIFGLIVPFFLLYIGRRELASIFRNVEEAFIFFPIFFYFYRVEVVRKTYKRFFPPTRTDRSSNIDIDNDRIFSRTPGIGEDKYFWTAIVAFAQDDKMTLLYLDENRFLLFPTRALSSEQRIELNELVARNMVRKSK